MADSMIRENGKEMERRKWEIRERRKWETRERRKWETRERRKWETRQLWDLPDVWGLGRWFIWFWFDFMFKFIDVFLDKLLWIYTFMVLIHCFISMNVCTITVIAPVVKFARQRR
jgi:hypothetical protein